MNVGFDLTVDDFDKLDALQKDAIVLCALSSLGTTFLQDPLIAIAAAPLMVESLRNIRLKPQQLPQVWVRLLLSVGLPQLAAQMEEQTSQAG